MRSLPRTDVPEVVRLVFVPDQLSDLDHEDVLLVLWDSQDHYVACFEQQGINKTILRALVELMDVLYMFIM